MIDSRSLPFVLFYYFLLWGDIYSPWLWAIHCTIWMVEYAKNRDINPCPLTLFVLLVKNMIAPPTTPMNKIIPKIIKNICHQNHHSQLWQVKRKSLLDRLKLSHTWLVPTSTNRRLVAPVGRMLDNAPPPSVDRHAAADKFWTIPIFNFRIALFV